MLTCKKCDKEISKCSKSGLCKSCSKLGENNPMYGKKLSKEHAEKLRNAVTGKNSVFFGKHLSDEHKANISKANRGENHWCFGNHFSEEHRRKIGASNSIALKGKKLSEEHRKNIGLGEKGRKLSNEWKLKIGAANKISHKGKILSSEHKAHIRLARIANIERDKFYGNQMYPAYNPNACKLIEEYGRTNGYNFQHAMNGGEYYIEGLGYWVDGYDKEKNVVIEVDEKKHFDANGNLKEKDVIRQKEIENKLKCQFLRIPIS